jgi:hypothetical protein
MFDAEGNVIPVEPGETLTSSPNGEWRQVTARPV